MYTIVEIKGKQYKAEVGSTLSVDHIDEKPGEPVEGIKVLLWKKEKEVKLGTPYLEEVKVSASVVSQKKDKKIKVVHYKPKINYKKIHGHRQKKTEVKIERIEG